MTQYVLSVHVPTSPKGAELAISGLGVFANGKDHKLDDELIETYRAMNSQEEVDSEGNVSTVLGPHPKDLLFQEGIQVKVARGSSEKEEEVTK